ncbi:MAG: hypothetical protein K6F39_06495 [Lachnospiraceae bacterium]|nr:hypothetical protein [Lachnospiraceae bacterium]
MSTRKMLILLIINYIPVYVWMFFFREGALALLLLLPVVMIIAFVDYFLVYGIKELKFAYVNLTAANGLGAVLHTYLFERYVMKGLFPLLFMLFSIFLFTASCIFSLKLLEKHIEKRKLQKDKRRASEISDKEDESMIAVSKRRKSDYIRAEEEEHDLETYDPDEDDDDDFQHGGDERGVK